MIGPDGGASEIPVFFSTRSQNELTPEQRKTGRILETNISGFLNKQTQNEKACNRFEDTRQKITKGKLVQPSDYQSIVESLGYKFEGPKAESKYIALYHLLANARNLNAIWKIVPPESDLAKSKRIDFASQSLARNLVAHDLNEKDLEVLLNML